MKDSVDLKKWSAIRSAGGYEISRYNMSCHCFGRDGMCYVAPKQSLDGSLTIAAQRS